MKKKLLITLLIINVILAFIIYSQFDKQGLIDSSENITSQGGVLPLTSEKIVLDQQTVKKECAVWSVFPIKPESNTAKEVAEIFPDAVVKVEKSVARWWVYVTPQRSAEVMREKIKILEDSGYSTREYTDRGRLRWSILLGYFTVEESARDFVKSLKKIGVDQVVLDRSNQLSEKISIKFENIKEKKSDQMIKKLKVEFRNSESQNSKC